MKAKSKRQRREKPMLARRTMAPACALLACRERTGHSPGLAFSGSRLVGVVNTGEVVTSVDGITWAIQPSATSSRLIGVAWMGTINGERSRSDVENLGSERDRRSYVNATEGQIGDYSNTRGRRCGQLKDAASVGADAEERRGACPVESQRHADGGGQAHTEHLPGSAGIDAAEHGDVISGDKSERCFAEAVVGPGESIGRGNDGSSVADRNKHGEGMSERLPFSTGI